MARIAPGLHRSQHANDQLILEPTHQIANKFGQVFYNSIAENGEMISPQVLSSECSESLRLNIPAVLANERDFVKNYKKAIKEMNKHHKELKDLMA